MFEKIAALMAEELAIPQDKITAEARLKEDLGVNSIDFAELVMQLEEELDIETDSDELRGIKTVGDLVAYLEAKQAK